MTQYKRVPPKHNGLPTQQTLFAKGDKWAELRAEIDALTPDGEGVQMTLGSLKELRSTQSYALTYVHNDINPDDYHIETKSDLESLVLTIWKVSGGRASRDLSSRLDQAKIGEAVSFKGKNSEELRALQRAAIKYGERREGEGFRITTKTVEGALFVWKVRF